MEFFQLAAQSMVFEQTQQYIPTFTTCYSSLLTDVDDDTSQWPPYSLSFLFSCLLLVSWRLQLYLRPKVPIKCAYSATYFVLSPPHSRSSTIGSSEPPWCLHWLLVIWCGWSLIWLSFTH